MKRKLKILAIWVASMAASIYSFHLIKNGYLI